MKDDIARVEAACLQLAARGEPIRYRQVAVLAGISKTTLYRRPDLHAVIEEHRVRGLESNTLSGLTVQVDQLRHGLEAVAEKVRHHEEAIRELQRQRRKKAG